MTTMATDDDKPNDELEPVAAVEPGAPAQLEGEGDGEPPPIEEDEVATVRSNLFWASGLRRRRQDAEAETNAANDEDAATVLLLEP